MLQIKQNVKIQEEASNSGKRQQSGKNVNIQKRTGHLKKWGVVGNSGKKFKMRGHINIKKTGTFEKIGPTSKVTIIMIRMIMMILMIIISIVTIRIII